MFDHNPSPSIASSSTSGGFVIPNFVEHDDKGECSNNCSGVTIEEAHPQLNLNRVWFAIRNNEQT